MKRLLSILTLIFWLSIQSWAACSSVVQSATPSTVSGTIAQAVFGSSMTAGHAIKGAISFCKDSGCGTDPSGVVLTISDGEMNTFVVDSDITFTNQWRLVTYHALNIAGGGAETVQVGSNVTVSYFGVLANEVSGLTATPIDVSGTANQVTPATSFSVTTSAPITWTKEFIYSAAVQSYGTVAAGAGFTLLTDYTLIGGFADECKEISSASGAQTAGWTTGTASTWTLAIDTLKETGGGAVGASTTKDFSLLQ